jgi:hypothetical protein
MKHIHFVIKKYYYCYYFIIIFLDGSLPLSKLTIPNPYGKFKLEGRNIIFQGYGYNDRKSLILFYYDLKIENDKKKMILNLNNKKKIRFLLFYSFPGTNCVPAPAVIDTPSFPQIP